MEEPHFTSAINKPALNISGPRLVKESRNLDDSAKQCLGGILLVAHGVTSDRQLSSVTYQLKIIVPYESPAP